MSNISQITEDILSDKPMGWGLSQGKYGTDGFIYKTIQGLTNRGLKCLYTYNPQAAGNVFNSTSQFSIQSAPGTVPDVLKDLFMEFTLTNTAAVGTLTISSYPSTFFRTQFSYMSSINLNYDNNVSIIHSLMQYNDEKWKTRAAQEGVNPTTYAPVVTVLNPGDSITYRVPLNFLPICDNNIWMRALTADLIFKFTWASQAQICVAAGGAAVTDLTISNYRLLFSGYSFSDSIREKINDAMRNGNTLVVRHIDFQSITQTIPSGVTTGQLTNYSLAQNNSLVIGGIFYVRSNNGQLANVFNPISGALSTVTLRQGGQDLNNYSPSLSGDVFRNVIANAGLADGSDCLFGPGFNALGPILYPFSPNISECVQKGLVFGSYYISTSNTLNATSAVTNANVELVTVYLRNCILIQSGNGNLKMQQL